MAELPAQIELQKYLGDVDYPCSKDELVQKAESSGAPSELVDLLRNASADSFDGPTDVSAALSTD